MKCSIEGCTRAYGQNGYCDLHWQRVKRGADPLHDPRAHLATKHEPTPRELEWAAGFLEGEGSFGVGSIGGERISAPQVNPEPIAKLKKLFGGRIHYKSANPPRQEQFIWEVNGARARGVMLTLFTLLSEHKQEQIVVALRARPTLSKVYATTKELV